MQYYEEYINHEAGNVLPVEEALTLYTDLVRTIGLSNNEYKDEIVNELIEKCINYSEIRAKWELWDRETKMKEDKGRTIRHNAVIDAFNILARLLNKDGIETSWRERLGDNRKRIGDFACFVVYMIGINNR